MLIVIAHGSRDPRWRNSVERVIDSIGRDIGTDRIRLAYMDCAPPSLMDVVSDAARSGTTRFCVLPLFLTSEGHVDRDIVPLVKEVQAAWPERTVELLPPLGQQPEFRAAIGRITVRTEDADREQGGPTP